MNLTAHMDAKLNNNSWITIGSFDGVHLGHQALIKALVDKAHSENAQALVVTFWPHPAAFFKRATLPRALTTSEERRDLLLSIGVDDVITLPFDQAIAALTPTQFLQTLKQDHGLKGLIIGPNTTIGRDRQGTPEKLIEIGRQLGINVEVIQPFINPVGMVSSSLIRTELREHKLEEANRNLGRPYRLSGKVVHGEHRGTGLGVPTANLEVMPERLIPGNGVYVTRALVDGKTYASVTNIGIRPTFDNPLPTPRIEPHILDLQGQFYNCALSLDFMKFLRPEIKFENAQDLVAQIQQDIAATRKFFDAEKNQA